MAQDHRVHLDAFHGPLDLLLHLIRRHELDIHDIPIAAIAEQYLAFLDGIERLDIDTAGEFLVTAATLMEIKSRMVAARSEGASGEDAARAANAGIEKDDPRYELVQQLLEYKRFRDSADELERRREAWMRRTAVAPIGVHSAELRAAFEAMNDELDLDDVGLSDIVEAFARIAATVNLDRIGEHEVMDDDTPIELHAADLVDRLERETGGQLALFGVLEGRTRREMIGVLLALLDLVRQGRVTFDQAQLGGHSPITIRLREEAERAREDAEDAAEFGGGEAAVSEAGAEGA